MVKADIGTLKMESREVWLMARLVKEELRQEDKQHDQSDGGEGRGRKRNRFGRERGGGPGEMEEREEEVGEEEAKEGPLAKD